MPPAVVTFTITRTSLSLPTLSLVDATAYTIPDESGRPLIDDGTEQNELQTVGSPWMDGAVLVHRKKGLATFAFSVDVIGSDHADLKSKESALRAAVDQSSFEVHYTLDGTDRGWSCLPFSQFQTQWTDEFVYGLVRRVAVAVPRQPNPL